MGKKANITIAPGAKSLAVTFSEASTEDGFEAVTLLEAGAVFDDAKREIVIRPIKTGFGNARDGFYYTKQALQEAVSSGVFKNRKMFANHPTQADEKARPERSVWDWVSTLKEAWWDDSSDEARARIKVYDDRFWTRAKQAPDEIAFSILGGGLARQGFAEGRQARIVESLTKIKSVDWVTEAGAGGGLVAFAESAREEFEMDLGTLTLEQLRDSRPDLLEEAFREADESEEDTASADDSLDMEAEADGADDAAAADDDAEAEDEAPEAEAEAADTEEADDDAEADEEDEEEAEAVQESSVEDDDEEDAEPSTSVEPTPLERIAALEAKLAEADLREAATKATKRGISIVEVALRDSTLPSFAKDQIKARFTEAQVGDDFAWPSDDILRKAIRNEIKLTSELVGNLSAGRGATSIGGDAPETEEVGTRETVSKQLADLWGSDPVPVRATADDNEAVASTTDVAVSADTEQPARMSEASASTQSEMEAKFDEWSV